MGSSGLVSRAAVKPAAVPHVREGSALPLTMTPRGRKVRKSSRGQANCRSRVGASDLGGLLNLYHREAA